MGIQRSPLVFILFLFFIILGACSGGALPGGVSAWIDVPLEGLTLGLVHEHFGEGLDSAVEEAVREAVRVYQSLGAKVKEISLPHSKYAIATYYIIAPSEASSNLARYDGVHYGYRTDEKAVLAELADEGRTLEGSANEREDHDSPLVRMYRRTRAEGFGAEVKRRIYMLVH